MRLARSLQTGGEGDPVDSEVVWASPEIRTEAETTDATIKKFQANLISHAQALEDMGYTPQQIEKIIDVAKQEAAEAQQQAIEQAQAIAATRPAPGEPPTA